MAFKRIKDMKKAVSAAPDMIEQAQQMQAQAQQMQAAQMAASGTAAAGTQAIDPRLLEPISGVTLEKYAELSKGIGQRKLDQAGIESFVKLHGVDAADWQAAYDGWNERFKGNMALSVHFGNLYQQARTL
jgi:hypothetical protein